MAAKSDAHSVRRKTDVAESLSTREQGLSAAINRSAKLLDSAEGFKFGPRKKEETEKEAIREQELPQNSTATSENQLGVVAKMSQQLASETVVIKVYKPKCKYGDKAVSFLGMKRDGSLFLTVYSKSTASTDPQRKFLYRLKSCTILYICCMQVAVTYACMCLCR